MAMKHSLKRRLRAEVLLLVGIADSHDEVDQQARAST
jgi:hypothetical protein